MHVVMFLVYVYIGILTVYGGKEVLTLSVRFCCLIGLTGWGMDGAKSHCDSMCRMEIERHEKWDGL